jgi:hypothetical protein
VLTVGHGAVRSQPTGIDEADPDADTVVAVLDGINGAWDRAQLGRRQAASGDTVRLEEL